VGLGEEGGGRTTGKSIDERGSNRKGGQVRQKAKKVSTGEGPDTFLGGDWSEEGKGVWAKTKGKGAEPKGKAKNELNRVRKGEAKNQ